MPKPAAKEKDRIVASDTHIVGGISVVLSFDGVIDGNLSADVIIEQQHAAMVDSTATNPPHTPAPDKPPSNRGVIVRGSSSVLINHRHAARDGDPAKTCNDPVDLPVGIVVASSTVIIGG